MANLTTIREQQFGALAQVIEVAHNVVQSAPADGLARWRDGGNGWTVGEVLCHLRDFDQIFAERAQLTLAHASPALSLPDPDQLAAERHYAALVAAEAWSQWAAARQAYLAVMRAVDAEQWERVAIHPRRGAMTLTDQLMLTLTHDVNHLAQITRIVAQRLG